MRFLVINLRTLSIYIVRLANAYINKVLRNLFIEVMRKLSFRHMEKEEGYMFLEGYIPTSRSGVTIATGYDLCWGSNIFFSCLNDEKLKSKLSPNRGLKSRSEFADKGLNAKSLKMKLEEAKAIDQCMLDHNKK